MNQYTVWAKGLQVSEDLDLSERNVGKALNRNNRWYQVSIHTKIHLIQARVLFEKCTFWNEKVAEFLKFHFLSLKRIFPENWTISVIRFLVNFDLISRIFDFNTIWYSFEIEMVFISFYVRVISFKNW